MRYESRAVKTTSFIAIMYLKNIFKKLVMKLLKISKKKENKTIVYCKLAKLF